MENNRCPQNELINLRNAAEYVFMVFEHECKLKAGAKF